LIGTHRTMELVNIYQCFCDGTRLRILNLLCQSSLCVCHFQELLDEPQVKISKHLSYLKEHGLVIATRDANWMIYSLPKKRSAELEKNLSCLQDCAREGPIFRRDLERWKKFSTKGDNSPICCGGSNALKGASAKLRKKVEIR
jgi:ArsR family transcriptional regulator, arsenate/arsenite/antimonite-responsive transcriptional repressor